MTQPCHGFPPRNTPQTLIQSHFRPSQFHFFTHSFGRRTQNINSQGFGSANLTRQAIETFHHYIAIALLFGVQAVDLRTYGLVGHYDAQTCLSPATARLYDAIRTVIGRPLIGHLTVHLER